MAAAYSVRLSGSREIENVTGAFEGQGAGTGHLNFLVGKGYFTDYRLNYSIDGGMVVRRGEDQARRMAVHPHAERGAQPFRVALGRGCART